MAESTSKTFEVTAGEAPLALAKVELHRIFEADKDGRTSIHVWMTAEATPTAETFQSIIADVAFVLSNGEAELGTCTSRAIAFAKKEPITITADDGLRIDSHADVTGIEVRMDVVRVVHETGELRLGPV